MKLNHDQDLEYSEPIYNDTPIHGCPMCGNHELILLGTLGNRNHFRCQDCHWDFSALVDPS
jgi:transposase-like protein